ncbi:carboxymuconolactone decarboxylase family protein, partial [Mesorhizobium sp. M00.F.Ca.ET.149.01.1.1]
MSAFFAVRLSRAVVLGSLAMLATPVLAHADDYDATLKDIQSTMGGVPSFVK